jgi:hypothetical protein
MNESNGSTWWSVMATLRPGGSCGLMPPELQLDVRTAATATHGIQVASSRSIVGSDGSNWPKDERRFKINQPPPRPLLGTGRAQDVRAW